MRVLLSYITTLKSRFIYVLEAAEARARTRVRTRTEGELELLEPDPDKARSPKGVCKGERNASKREKQA